MSKTNVVIARLVAHVASPLAAKEPDAMLKEVGVTTGVVVYAGKLDPDALAKIAGLGEVAVLVLADGTDGHSLTLCIGSQVQN